MDVAIDSSGSIYISSHGNQAIRKVDGATGFITTVAGTLGSPGWTSEGGLAASDKLNNLYSVAVDSSGDIYIADVRADGLTISRWWRGRQDMPPRVRYFAASGPQGVFQSDWLTVPRNARTIMVVSIYTP